MSTCDKITICYCINRLLQRTNSLTGYDEIKYKNVYINILNETNDSTNCKTDAMYFVGEKIKISKGLSYLDHLVCITYFSIF